MMLTNGEIIELYQENKFDIIINNLKLTPEWNICHKKDLRTLCQISGRYTEKLEYSNLRAQFEYINIINMLPDKSEYELTYDSDSKHILAHAIYTTNIELFQYTLTVDNLCSHILINILRNPQLYPILGHLLEQNNNLYDMFKIMLNLECCRTISYDITSQNNITLLKFILQYFPNEEIMCFICESAICVNNLEILNILFECEYNIQDGLDIIMKNLTCLERCFSITLILQLSYRSYIDCRYTININFGTFEWLIDHKINILNFVDHIYIIFCFSNDLIGIKYCIENGSNADFWLTTITKETNFSVIKYLIENVININSLDFIDVCDIMKESLEIIIYLIEFGLDISNYVDKLCAGHNDLSIIKFGITYGADVNYLLCEIPSRVDLSIIKYLIENGADLHTIKYKTVIKIIKDIQNAETIIYLIESGLDISTYMFELFLYAIVQNNIELALYFIKLNSDLVSIEDNISLFLASYIGSIDIVQILLDNGADVHARNDSILVSFDRDFRNSIAKILPDMEMYRYGRYSSNIPKIIVLLIKNGAIFNDPGYALSIIAIKEYGTDEELLDMILKSGIDINIMLKFERDNRPSIKYILESFVLYDDVDIFKRLINNNADPFINSHGPLKTAIGFKKKNILELLLELGSVVDSEFLNKTKIPEDIKCILEKYGYVI